MLFKSPVYTQASGSIGGITYSRNRGGMYTRARAIPTNPNTSQQQAVRALMGTLTNRWSNVLTEAQRVAWAGYASNVPVSNRLGDSVLISGINHYIRSNLPRAQTTLGVIDDGPTTFNLGSFTPTSITASVGTGISATYDNTDEWANATGGFLIFYGGKSVAPTINFFSGPYRVFGAEIGDGTTAPTSPFTDTTIYPLIEGGKTYFRIRASQADGRLSDVQELMVVAVA